MENQQWHRLAGAAQVECFPFVRRPDVFSSNAYLLSSPDHITIIDPGGCREQTEALLAIIQGTRHQPPVPVSACLTHCHIDHALESIQNPRWRELPGWQVTLHAAGVNALRTGDRRITQAENLGVEVPPCPAGEWLCAAFGGDHGTRHGPVLPVGTIPLGSHDLLQVYHTPGHSPDSVCYRVGEAIFIGDLLVAVSPLIAGAPGWSHPDLVTSLQTILELVSTNPIRFCCPGHGPVLTGAAICQSFQKALREAATLARIEIADAARLHYISNYAQELFEELGALFALINRRIVLLAQRLHDLEELSAARQIRQILESDQAAQLILEFRNYQEGLQTGDKIEAQVAMKAMQVVHRIRRLLDDPQLKRLLEPCLLRTAQTLLADFGQAAKGLRLEEERLPADLNALIRSLLKELVTPPGAQIPLEDIPDDPAGFSDYLISAFTALPWSKKVCLRGDIPEESTLVPMVEERLHDTLRRLLEDLAELGASSITVSMPASAPKPTVFIEAAFERTVYDLSERSFQPYRRRCRLAGGQLSLQFTPTALRFSIRFGQSLEDSTD